VRDIHLGPMKTPPDQSRFGMNRNILEDMKQRKTLPEFSIRTTPIMSKNLK